VAKNRKNQAAAIRFGPALKASFLCLLIAGSAIGYVWQKNQIDHLGKQISELEKKLDQTKRDNDALADQISYANSPVMLDQLAKKLNLGLAPVQPSQLVSLVEPSSSGKVGAQPFAGRPMVALTQ